MFCSFGRIVAEGKKREKEILVKFLDKIWFHGFIEKISAM